MRPVERFLNRREQVVFRELERIAADNGLRAFPHPRVCDVIEKGQTFLTQREFDYLTRSHFDFILVDSASKPLMAIEYDGPFHATGKQAERDQIKNELCQRAGMGLLRINDLHVTKLFRGMTVLRWIVEVTELEKTFTEAQMNGQIPQDEPFDPAFFNTLTGGPSFPYWLSADASLQINSFMRKRTDSSPKGWSSIIGSDGSGTDHRLTWVYFDGKVVFCKNSIRNQDLSFPHYDLLAEVNGCELGIKFGQFRRNEVQPISAEQFKNVFHTFVERYDAHPSHSQGVYPFSAKWDFEGWKF